MIAKRVHVQFSVLAAAALVAACGGGGGADLAAPSASEVPRNAPAASSDVECSGTYRFGPGSASASVQLRLAGSARPAQAEVCNYSSLGEGRYVSCNASLDVANQVEVEVNGFKALTGPLVLGGTADWKFGGFTIPMTCRAAPSPITQAAPTPPGRTPPPPPAPPVPPPPPAPPGPPPGPAPILPTKLTGTGIAATSCYEAGSDTLIACSGSTTTDLNPNQDGHRASQLIRSFSYSLVGGNPLTSCVNDDRTGLVWEGKDAAGPRDRFNSYTNLTDSGRPQFWNGLAWVAPTAAQINATTNSVGYVTYVNSIALCGFTDWRMPTRHELMSIISYAANSSTAVDENWFVNSIADRFWTDSPVGGGSENAWLITTDYGSSRTDSRDYPHPLRLVRGGQ